MGKAVRLHDLIYWGGGEEVFCLVFFNQTSAFISKIYFVKLRCDFSHASIKPKSLCSLSQAGTRAVRLHYSVINPHNCINTQQGGGKATSRIQGLV